jgi:prepilin-type N-terminal cleavage/methylation domain-containing protein
MNSKQSRLSGFSLLELIVVVVIIGIIAAVAIPRLSRGSAGAANSALAGDLAVLRNAIDLYSAEHSGAFPTLANATTAMTQYTDASGAVSAAKDATHIYGPYVRKIPPLPVGARTGSNGIDSKDGTGIGWIYDATTGNLSSNTSATEADEAGKLYNTY